jgi:hypothetical protein
VRQIVDGIAYDTDTAIKITGGDNGHWSDAWWGLYRTESGTFFKIVVGHDGETLQEWRTLTVDAARATVEQHANYLVEQHFGPMPEPRAMRFSRRTVIAAIEVMERAIQTHAGLTRCLLKWSPELNARCDSGTLTDRFNELINFCDENPTRHIDGGGPLQDALVEHAVSLLPRSGASADTFQHALDLDGFTVTDGALRRTLPRELELPQAEDDIARLLAKHGFTTPKGHLDQALDAHGRGEWAAANAQLRAFFEGLLDEIATSLDATAAALPTSENRKARLGNLGFLDESLNEWGNDGKNFINGLWKRLHPSGSHPGLSDQDDSTFRLHIVLLTARLLLTRFDAWGTR